MHGKFEVSPISLSNSPLAAILLREDDLVDPIAMAYVHDCSHGSAP